MAKVIEDAIIVHKTEVVFYDKDEDRHYRLNAKNIVKVVCLFFSFVLSPLLVLFAFYKTKPFLYLKKLSNINNFIIYLVSYLHL